MTNHNNVYNHGSSRVGTGRYGEDMVYSNMYYIYVHKRDYDKACEVLQNC